MGRKDYTHEDAINIIRSLGNALGLKEHTDAMGLSFYYVSEKVVVRISDHSAHLQTWVDYGTYSIEKKYSIVIEVNPSKPDPNINQDVQQFVVKEYKHRLNLTFWKYKEVDDKVILQLMNAVKGAIGNGGEFSNPFSVSPKLIASVYTPPKEDKTTSLTGETRSTQNNKTDKNESKNMNRKNAIRLTESELKNIITESVKKVLKESNPYLSEINKNINYFHSEALEKLNGLKQAFEEIPDEYESMKRTQIALVNQTIKNLKLIYSGANWTEDGPSLSMMNRLDKEY